MMLIDLISREGGSTVRESGSAEICNNKNSNVSGRNAARNYLAFLSANQNYCGDDSVYAQLFVCVIDALLVSEHEEESVHAVGPALNRKNG